MELLKTNQFNVVGTLKSVDLQERTSSKTGNQFVSGSILVESIIKGETNEFVIDLFANKLTADKKPSKLYENYLDLNNLIGKKIDVSGNLSENRYFSEKSNQMASRQTLSGRFIKGVVPNTADSATFSVGGFVVSNLVEKKRKDNSIYAYELTLAQANYREDNLTMFRLQVKPEDTDIVRGIEKTYKVGDTVLISGELNFLVETTTQTIENAFGAPTVKTYQNRYNSFYVTGGSNPEQGESAYSTELIQSLIAAYKAKDVEIKAAADERNASNGSIAEQTPAQPSISARQVSLI